MILPRSIFWRSAAEGWGRPLGGMLPSRTRLRIASQTGILAFVERGVELIDPDTRSAEIRVIGISRSSD